MVGEILIACSAKVKTRAKVYKRTKTRYWSVLSIELIALASLLDLDLFASVLMADKNRQVIPYQTYNNKPEKNSKLAYNFPARKMKITLRVYSYIEI